MGAAGGSHKRCANGWLDVETTVVQRREFFSSLFSGSKAKQREGIQGSFEVLE